MSYLLHSEPSEMAKRKASKRTISKLNDSEVFHGLLLVTFHAAAPPTLGPKAKTKKTQEKLGDGERIERLRRELQYMKESHQTTLEELETANEELTSTNEELQSTNEELETSKEEMQSLNEELTTDKRCLRQALAGGLNPVDVDPQGLPSALEELVRRSGELYGISCVFHCDGCLFQKAEIATQQYRIAQEAVNKAAKHGNSTKIEICLERTSGHIRLRVTDDAKGIEQESGQGLGMRSLGYRAPIIGDQLQVQLGQHRGTVVKCLIPFTVAEQWN